MKIILLTVSAAILFAACSSNSGVQSHTVEMINEGAVYGDSIGNSNIIQLASLPAEMDAEAKKDIKIRGKVEEVCKKKGCWMVMKLDNGKDMRVTFKDYKIFVPQDLVGKEVVLDGFAYKDTTTVERLQHYAEDAGKSEAEIAAIVEPEIGLAYEAKGVAVMN